MMISSNVSKEYALEVAMLLGVVAWMDEDLDDSEVSFIYDSLGEFGELTEYETWKIKYQLAYPHNNEELNIRINYLVSKTKTVAEKKYALQTLEDFIAVDGKVWPDEQEIYERLFNKLYPK
jgi:hypothetical protein